MNITNFDFYKDLLAQKSGLSLSEEKTYLLNSRLLPLAKEHGFQSLDEMAISLLSRPNDILIKDIVEAMTTNETSFFRDNTPFERLKDTILPHVMNESRTKPVVRIWSAACSTGQEPYSIAMVLLENPHIIKDLKFEIMATDICSRVLSKAEKGEFTQLEVQRGLPIQTLVKYFEQRDNSWVIKDDVKRHIHFKKFNLLENMGGLGTFDIIFCRNVLIYFDKPTKQDVLERMAKCLEKEGCLMLGSSETIFGVTEKLKSLNNVSGLFVKNNEN